MKKIYIVENLDEVRFNRQGYFSMRVIFLDGLANAKAEKKAKSEGLQQQMKIYELVEKKS